MVQDPVYVNNFFKNCEKPVWEAARSHLEKIVSTIATKNIDQVKWETSEKVNDKPTSEVAEGYLPQVVLQASVHFDSRDKIEAKINLEHNVDKLVNIVHYTYLVVRC